MQLLNILEIVADLPSWVKNGLSELSDYFDDTETMFAEMEKDSDKFNEAVDEWAEAQVSVYTADRFAWAAQHVKEIGLYEDDVANDKASIENRVAYCWYASERDQMREVCEVALKKLKNCLDV